MPERFDELQNKYLFDIQEYLKIFIHSIYTNPYTELRDIFYYHLGLDDPLQKQGKRIRPLLTLVSAAGAGVPENKALPAAAAIELIHNFSLIHDDIEDNGDVRRGKPAVWKKWGLAQGLNAGDAMFNAAFLALGGLRTNFSAEIQTEALNLISETCNLLTKGQYLDMRFEKEADVSMADYHQMILGKTSALIACSVEMGALLGKLDKDQRALYRKFGEKLGIAFQIYDDWLGIWGEEEKTGKSAIGDLVEKKRSFPILKGIEISKDFKDQFLNRGIDIKSAIKLRNMLEKMGIDKKVKDECAKWTREALIHLRNMECKENERKFLEMITNNLLIRVK